MTKIMLMFVFVILIFATKITNAHSIKSLQKFHESEEINTETEEISTETEEISTETEEISIETEEINTEFNNAKNQSDIISHQIYNKSVYKTQENVFNVTKIKYFIPRAEYTMTRNIIYTAFGIILLYLLVQAYRFVEFIGLRRHVLNRHIVRFYPNENRIE